MVTHILGGSPWAALEVANLIDGRVLTMGDLLNSLKAAGQKHGCCRPSSGSERS